VEVLSGDAGEIGEAEKAVLAAKPDMTDKSRLSCQVRVSGDLHVEVVSQASVKGMEAGPRPTE
jgi:ferredoxin